MSVSKGNPSISKETVLEKTTEVQLLSHYMGINKIPCVINSPFRSDKTPSFGIYTRDGVHILYKDFSTNESGDTFKLLGRLWNLDYTKTLLKILNDVEIPNSNMTVYKSSKTQTRISKTSDTELYCKIRDWKQYDLEYWESYGITLPWLQYAEVYPISHKIIKKDGKTYTFSVDKYAYVYVEHKEGKTTLKIYQPFNKNGFKWTNKHDSSVISLWTKVPEKGDMVCVCSSLKDALCLWVNCGIPSIAVQGEGYSMSNTAVKQLKKRFKKQYILFDNDLPGIKDGIKLSEETGFKNIVLPKINNAKDISDLYLSLNNKEKFKTILTNLFK